MLLTSVSNAGRQTCVTSQSPSCGPRAGGFYFRLVCLMLFVLLWGVKRKCAEKVMLEWSGTTLAIAS